MILQSVRKWWNSITPRTKIIILGVAMATIVAAVIWRQYVLYILGGAAVALTGTSKISIERIRKPDPVKPQKVEMPNTPTTAGDIVKRRQERAAKADKLRGQ